MAERKREPNAPTTRGQQGSGRLNEQIALFRNRVSLARQIRDNWRQRYKLDRLYELYLGDVAEAVLQDNSIMSDTFTVNKTLPTIKTVIPSLFLQNPVFIVRSKSENTDGRSVLKAKMAEAALRSIAEQEHHLEFSIRLALLQSFFSIGVLKTVYQPKMIKNPRAGEIMLNRDEAGLPIIDEASGMAGEMLDADGAPMIEPDFIPDDETYRWDWVNGDKMLLPDSGPAHLRWPWVAEEVTVLLEDARDDDRFPKELRTQLQSNASSLDDSGLSSLNGSLDGTYMPQTEGMGRHQDDYLTYIEMWDIRKRRQIIWCEGQTFSHTRFLLNRETPESVEHHPYSLLLGYTPIIGKKSSPWPMPHIYSWLPLQREHNIRRRQLTNAAKRTARKVIYEEDTFPDHDQAVAHLQSSEDMQGVKVTSLDRPPRVLEDPPLASNVAQDLSILEIDWNFVTGVSGARTGGRNRGADSVFEARTQVQSGEMRDLDMRHSVNVWMTTAGRKMLRLIKSTLSLGMYVKMRGASDSHFQAYIARVYGPNMARSLSEFPNLRLQFDQDFGSDKWLMLSPEDLDFEADVTVAPGSARPRNMETEKQDFFQILQILGSVPILTQSRALLNRVADMFEFFDIAMIDEIMAASQKANEIEQMKAGRLQGGGGSTPQQAANGNGANISSFRRNFIG